MYKCLAVLLCLFGGSALAVEPTSIRDPFVYDATDKLVGRVTDLETNGFMAVVMLWNGRLVRVYVEAQDFPPSAINMLHESTDCSGPGYYSTTRGPSYVDALLLPGFVFGPNRALYVPRPGSSGLSSLRYNSYRREEGCFRESGTATGNLIRTIRIGILNDMFTPPYRIVEGSP